MDMTATTDKTHSLPSSWSTHADKGSDSIVERITWSHCAALVRMTNSIKQFDPSSSYVFDNGAGTGMLTAQLKAHNTDLKIFATDISPGMIKALQDTARSENWSHVEAAGWKVRDSRVQKVNWGWKDADEVDQYIFEAGNPIVGLLMEGFSVEELESCREAFRQVVVEDSAHGMGIYETAILVTAVKE